MKIVLVPLIVLLTGCSQRPSDDMVILEGGTFLMGSASAHYEDESPAHTVEISPFAIDANEVTNAQFQRFVEVTGYLTDAEKHGYGWVFRKGAKDWEQIQGADWHQPEGPDSDIKDRMNHPVVQVSWNDAVAYARWAGKRLPTEAEWEFAARGGKKQLTYPWGEETKPNGKTLANFWQGTWPNENLLEDGFYYTAPVGSFPPNDFGLYDMVGNAWEWTADWYAEDYYKLSPVDNPLGPETGTLKVARGGSWYCGQGHCGAYRNAYRGRSPQDASFNNVGFRCVKLRTN